MCLSETPTRLEGNHSRMCTFCLYKPLNHYVTHHRLYLDVTLMYVGLGSVRTVATFLCVEVLLLYCTFLVHPGFMVTHLPCLHAAIMHAALVCAVIIHAVLELKFNSGIE